MKEIRGDSVVLETREGLLELRNDAVVVCAGGILPTPFLQSIGVAIETKHGTA